MSKTPCDPAFSNMAGRIRAFSQGKEVAKASMAEWCNGRPALRHWIEPSALHMTGGTKRATHWVDPKHFGIVVEIPRSLWTSKQLFQDQIVGKTLYVMDSGGVNTKPVRPPGAGNPTLDDPTFDDLVLEEIRYNACHFRSEAFPDRKYYCYCSESGNFD